MLLILILFFPQLCLATCPDVAACIARVRKIVAEPRHYWFGEQWRETCIGRHVDPIQCYNPKSLQTFHSLGSRLFRVQTYQNDYLRNLRIFPTISYRSEKDGIQTYRACDHDFTVKSNGGVEMTEIHPDMEAVKPFDVRYAPDVQWTGIYNHSYLILAIDVGFGTLNYLALRSPSGDKVRTFIAKRVCFLLLRG
ncbi:unnamed protein product [Gongylonema pulchrum]|uniref:Uncharacterized protein n=1 Tax=Gongylonema pulchrum TaxID=637853 RepID=A0A183EFU6_9BILA|nr:unnamed protein product [Gongylonema pulchrum]